MAIGIPTAMFLEPSGAWRRCEYECGSKAEVAYDDFGEDTIVLSLDVDGSLVGFL